MEFFFVITNKVENPIDVKEAITIIEGFLKSKRWKIVDRDADTFLNALDLVSKHEIHLWDALIAACMKENEIVEFVTEDKKDFKDIPGIIVAVPF